MLCVPHRVNRHRRVSFVMQRCVTHSDETRESPPRALTVLHGVCPPVWWKQPQKRSVSTRVIAAEKWPPSFGLRLLLEDAGRYSLRASCDASCVREKERGRWKREGGREKQLIARRSFTRMWTNSIFSHRLLCIFGGPSFKLTDLRRDRAGSLKTRIPCLSKLRYPWLGFVADDSFSLQFEFYLIYSSRLRN